MRLIRCLRRYLDNLRGRKECSEGEEEVRFGGEVSPPALLPGCAPPPFCYIYKSEFFVKNGMPLPLQGRCRRRPPERSWALSAVGCGAGSSW